MGGAMESPSRTPQGQSVANLIALVLFSLRGSICTIILVTKILRRKNFNAWINQQHDLILIHIGVTMKKSPSAPLCGLQAANIFYPSWWGNKKWATSFATFVFTYLFIMNSGLVEILLGFLSTKQNHWGQCPEYVMCTENFRFSHHASVYWTTDTIGFQTVSDITNHVCRFILILGWTGGYFAPPSCKLSYIWLSAIEWCDVEWWQAQVCHCHLHFVFCFILLTVYHCLCVGARWMSDDRCQMALGEGCVYHLANIEQRNSHTHSTI